MEVQQPTINWEDGSLTEELSRFEQHIRLMFIRPLAERTENSMCAYLLIWTGKNDREIYNTFDLKDGKAHKTEPLLEHFWKCASPKTNNGFARFLFQKRDQLEGKSVKKYIKNLKTLAKPCMHKEHDEMIRDRIVCGIKNQAVREKLLAEGDSLTLKKCCCKMQNPRDDPGLVKIIWWKRLHTT